ncbi:MAG TPA: TPM domain-containing protein, partial [Candidatus Cloacimonadota bacterium]|nr:TPM domain-containing protein [Candidatus Cloacimonadota bacterium]
MKFKTTILVLLLGLICILVAQDFKIAPAEGFVNDFANILSSETRIRLNDWAIELREKTGVDLAIGTFPEMGGLDDLSFGDRVFQTWKVGSQRDEGVLIWLAVNERRLGIETGYGAEGYITDAFAASIRDRMA